VVFHRYNQPANLREIFNQIQQSDLYEKCKSPENERKLIKKFIDEGPGSEEIVFTDWRFYFDEYFKNKNPDI